MSNGRFGRLRQSGLPVTSHSLSDASPHFHGMPTE
jgi:hypothetical protein